MHTIVMIDGENFKGKLKAVFDSAGKARPLWYTYDFKGLFGEVLKGFVIDKIIFYFAHIKEHEKSKTTSRRLIEEQRKLKTHLEQQGFTVILSGRVRGQMEKSPIGKEVLIFREKGVDVKIAVDMVSLSCDKKVQQIILGSSDSDLQPAIMEIQKRNTPCVYMGFEIQPNRGISYTTTRTILVKTSEVLAFTKKTDILQSMKTILVDAVDCFVSPEGQIFAPMHELLETYDHKKIIVTGANDEQFKKFGLDKMPYKVFTLKHNPEKTDPTYFHTLLESFGLTAENVVYFEHNPKAVESAQSVGISSYFYDNTIKDLKSLKKFLDTSLSTLPSKNARI